MSTDVIVVGAGMVGATAALALGQAGFTVTLLEAALPPRLHVDDPPDLRVSAISPASHTFFERLGVWQSMLSIRVAAYRHMHVWDANNGASLHFDAQTIEATELGYIIENRIIQQALLDAIEQTETITLLSPVRWHSLSQNDSSVTIQLEDGQKIHAQVLLAADGADSKLRDAMGIAVSRKDYGQSGVVASVTTESGHSDTAWQRFLSTGPLAMLPLYNGQCSIVWSTTPEQATALCEMTETAFCEQLTQASEARLGSVLAASKRAAFPLRLQQAESYIGPRFAMIGDAAHTVHPLAGQGVNLGLGDAQAMLEVMQAAREQGRDIGGERCLNAYQRQRRGVDTLMGKAFDAIKMLFAQNDEITSTVRFLGLQAVDRSGIVKKMLMKVAMGR